MRTTTLLLCALLALATAPLPTTSPGKRHGSLFGSKSKGKGLGASPEASALGKLRLDMLKWYCDPSKSNTEARPCVNYAFMNKLKAATSVEERKKLVQDRSSTMPKDDAGRKSLALSSRAAYTSMYQEYCANPSAAPNPDVCTNEPLKRVYANLAKTAGAATPKL